MITKFWNDAKFLKLDHFTVRDDYNPFHIIFLNSLIFPGRSFAVMKVHPKKIIR